MVENVIQNDGHNIGVNIFFFNVDDVNVQTLDNIYAELLMAIWDL